MASIFTKIIKGEIPCTKVYEDEKFLAFLDIQPVNKGHVLVIPKKEVVTILECEPALFLELMATAQKIARAISSALGVDGMNVFINNGKAAGQEVAHLHVHLVPRFLNDGKTFKWPHTSYDQGEMDIIAKRIKKFL